MHLALWYVVFVCHQYDVCENSVDSVYVGGYGDDVCCGVWHSGWGVCFVLCGLSC